MTRHVEVRADMARKIGPLPHHWNYIGYDECNYSHTPGGMKLLKAFGTLPDAPYYVRCHHMLVTGIMHPFYKWGSTNVYTEDENGDPVYCFETLDKIFDEILKSGGKPFFEIGFMPLDLADPRLARDGKRYAGHGNLSEYQQIGWSMPPKDWDRWYDLIHVIAAHLKERYGEKELASWYFEMWNEPDIFYWRGTHAEFCKLYDYTEAALHDVLPDARFGGPATTGTRDPEGNATKFLDGFLKHIREGINYYTGSTGTRIDFTTFHTKGGGYRFDPLSLRKKQLPSVQTLVENVRTQASVLKKWGYGDLECVLSEADPDGWAAGGRFDNHNLNFRNTEYYATYTASGYYHIEELARELDMDIRPLAWAFMFEGERCFEGTRTFSTQGVEKPMMGLFRLLGRLGTEEIELSSSGAQDLSSFPDPWGTGLVPEINGRATSDGKHLSILLFSHHDDWDESRDSVIDLQILSAPNNRNAVMTVTRIDADHANAYTAWKNAGSPDWPDKDLLARFRQASELKPESAPLENKNGTFSASIYMPSHALALIEIDFE